MNDAEPAPCHGAHVQVKFRRGVQVTALTPFPLQYQSVGLPHVLQHEAGLLQHGLQAEKLHGSTGGEYGESRQRVAILLKPMQGQS